MMTKRDAEATLGLIAPYSKADMRAAYKAGVKKWHPDRASAQGIDPAVASEMFVKVAAAEKYLSPFFKDKPDDFKLNPSPADADNESEQTASDTTTSSSTARPTQPNGSQEASPQRRRRRATTTNSNSSTSQQPFASTTSGGWQTQSTYRPAYQQAYEPEDVWDPPEPDPAPEPSAADTFRSISDDADRIRRFFLGLMTALFLISAVGAINLFDPSTQSPLTIAKLFLTPLSFLVPGFIEWRFELISKVVCGSFDAMADQLDNGSIWAHVLVFLLKAGIAVFRFLLLVVSLILEAVFKM